MIKELTQEQVDLIPVYRDKWMEIGLDTSPLNKDKVREAIDKVYECAGLKPPKEIIYTESPLESLKYFDEFIKYKKIINHQTRDIVNHLAVEKIKNSVDKSIRKQIEDSIYTILSDCIWFQLMGLITRSLINHSGCEAASCIYNTNTGQHDVNYLSCFNFYDEVLGLREETKKLDGLIMAAKECGWFIPFEDLCIISNKPSKILFTEDINNYPIIHSNVEPAIQYNDNLKIWVKDGILVKNTMS